jgi:hypothetical protein
MSIPILQEADRGGSSFFKGLRSGFEQSAPQSIHEMIGSFKKSKDRERLFDSLNIKEGFGEVTPEKLLKIYQFDPQMASVLAPFAVQHHKHFLEEQSAASEKEAKANEVGGILDELEGLKQYAGSTRIPFTASWQATEGGLNRKGLEKRSEIDPMALSLEGFFRDMATKGALPQKTFNELLQRIPKSGDSERVYQGKINGIRKILKKKAPHASQGLEKHLSGKKDGEKPSLEDIFSETAD